MHDETNLVEHTAVNGPIAITQLSVLIDEKINKFFKNGIHLKFLKNEWN